MSDEVVISLGQRIAMLRTAKGLTQKQLAQRMGKSSEWVSAIERGKRSLSKVDLICDLASCLGVATDQLLILPNQDQDAQIGVDDEKAIGFRAALLSPDLLTVRGRECSEEQKEQLDPKHISQQSEVCWDMYQKGQVDQLLILMPRFITQAQRLHSAGTALSLCVASRILHLAALICMKIEAPELAWIAAERSLRSAVESGDPLYEASATRAMMHALLDNQQFQQAMSLGDHSISKAPSTLCHAGWTIQGMTHLRMAETAALKQDRDTAADHLQQADRVAEKVSPYTNLWRTGFGPLNVAAHRIAVNLHLDDARAAAQVGLCTDFSSMAPERRATVYIQLAQAETELQQDEDAATHLLAASEAASDLVRHSQSAQSSLKDLQRRCKNASLSNSLSNLLRK